MEAVRQASRLGGVEDSCKMGYELKTEKVAGWIKSKQRFIRGIQEICRVNTMISDTILLYSEAFGIDD